MREELVSAVAEAVLPVEATIPLPKSDPEKEVYVRAAVAYDRAKAEREEYMRLLEQSKMALQVQDNKILALELQLSTERNRYDALQNSFNEVLQDRADLEALLANLQCDLESQAAKLGKFEFSRVRRKRNGKRNGTGEPVSDTQGSTGEVPDFSSVLAHGQPVLGSQSEGR